MTFWGPADERRLEKRCRELMAAGKSLKAAICNLHKEGFGKLLLVGPVANLTNGDRHEAMRVIVQATSETEFDDQQ